MHCCVASPSCGVDGAVGTVSAMHRPGPLPTTLLALVLLAGSCGAPGPTVQEQDGRTGRIGCMEYRHEEGDVVERQSTACDLEQGGNRLARTLDVE